MFKKGEAGERRHIKTRTENKDPEEIGSRWKKPTMPEMEEFVFED